MHNYSLYSTEYTHLNGKLYPAQKPISNTLQSTYDNLEQSYKRCQVIVTEHGTVATRWAVRGSNPGARETFRTRPDPPRLLHDGYRVISEGKEAAS